MAGVLIVFDDRDVGLIYSLLLQRAGFTTLRTTICQEALNMLESGQEVDIVFLDDKILQEDNYHFLDVLKNTYPDKSVMIYALPGGRFNETLALEKGADVIFYMPVKHDEMVAAARKLVPPSA